MKRDLFKWVGLFILLFLGGCSGGLVDMGQDKVADNIYDLSLPDQGKTSMGGEEKILMLGQMTYPAYMKSEKIAVRPAAHVIQYLANSRWNDKAASLLENYIRINLDQTEGWMVINRSRSTLAYKYRLDLDVRDFSMHAEQGSAPVIVFTVSADLLHVGPIEVIARKDFSARVMASDNTGEAIISAFNEAAAKVSKDMQGWLGQAEN